MVNGPRVKDYMQAQVQTVAPELSLPELESAFLRHGVSGFPVVVDGELVGVISRSDVVRQLCVERTVAQAMSDYYWDYSGFYRVPENEDFNHIASRIGKRVDHMQVADVMIRDVITVSSDDALIAAGRLLLNKHIHRVPVTAAGRLVGLITSLDFVRYVVESARDTAQD